MPATGKTPVMCQDYALAKPRVQDGVKNACLFYNNFVVGSISEEEKATMRKATEILQRLYGKK